MSADRAALAEPMHNGCVAIARAVVRTPSHAGGARAVCGYRTKCAAAKTSCAAPKSKTDRTSLSGPFRYARPPVTAAILRVSAEKNQQRSHGRALMID